MLLNLPFFSLSGFNYTILSLAWESLEPRTISVRQALYQPSYAPTQLNLQSSQVSSTTLEVCSKAISSSGSQTYSGII